MTRFAATEIERYFFIKYIFVHITVIHNTESLSLCLSLTQQKEDGQKQEYLFLKKILWNCVRRCIGAKKEEKKKFLSSRIAINVVEKLSFDDC